MADFMCRPSLESTVFPILAQIVKVQLHFVRDVTGCVTAPETYGMIGSVVEESRFIFVGPHRKPIHLPGMGLGTHQKPIEAEPHVGAFAHIHEPARPILQFLSTCSNLHGSPGSVTANLKIPGLKVQFFLINWPGTSCSPGIDSALQFKERADMGTKVQVCAQHVSLVEIAIPKRRLAPIVISYLFPNLPCLATKGEVPVFGVLPQGNIFDWVPDVA